MKIFFTTICALLMLQANAQQQKFSEFSKQFVDGYTALNLPQLELSYVTGLQHIGNAENIGKQEAFFRWAQVQLPFYKDAKLDGQQKIDYELIKYESDINLQRLALEEQWIKNPPAKISAEGIITVPNGKAWYQYLLKRWVSADVTPDEIFHFGLKEVARVKAHIEGVRAKTGLSEDAFYRHLNNAEFFTTDSVAIKQAFERNKQIVLSNLHNIFSVTQISDLKIARGTNTALVQTPGYYTDNTFYYNLTDKPYNKRAYDWLFIHEGIPGHHYQGAVSPARTSAVQELFFYYGFAEGWGAYAEELGKDVGLYKTPYDELGKWEWDIVRSVRVPLDVGINYYGWTDAQALEFWKKNIRGQDDIAMREINRIKRWPAQVVTYKYGALQIMGWKQELQKKRRKAFDVKKFHDKVLEHGTLPLGMIKENVFKGV